MLDPGLSQIVYRLMAEATAAATADGVPLTDTGCKEMFDSIRGIEELRNC